MNVKLARSLDFSQRRLEHDNIPVELLSFRGAKEFPASSRIGVVTNKTRLAYVVARGKFIIFNRVIPRTSRRLRDVYIYIYN